MDYINFVLPFSSSSYESWSDGPKTQNETDTASFTCQATGEPVPTISWYFNDVPVDVTDTTKYTVSVTSSNVTTNSGIL